MIDRSDAEAAFKAQVHSHFDEMAPERDAWIERNAYFYECDQAYMRFLIPSGASVLELGCGTGQLLDALEPSRGVGVDLSPEMIRIAKENYPALTFHEGDIEDPEFITALEGPFDFIVLSDTVDSLYDCQQAFAGLQALCGPDTRLVIAHYSHFWEPALDLAERLGTKMPQTPGSWLAPADIAALLDLSGFETVKTEYKQLLPRRLLGLGTLVNRYVASLPLIRRLCLRHYVVARSLAEAGLGRPSASIVVPCRNEAGNIENAILRTPKFCEEMEFLFVEGNSTDGTWAECQRVRDAYPDVNIKIMQQDGRGKGDAVRKGFAAAEGDILLILDADLTTPPESMGKFYEAIASGKGEFINGTRLVYPYEKGAMRFLNSLANRAFAAIFSYLLNQRFTDTLCGTKVLHRDAYDRIAENRDYFGEFDPFGDFDLIFGATKLNLKLVEIPVRYADRSYGETNISRFRHGWLLLKMVAFAYRKLKAI